MFMFEFSIFPFSILAVVFNKMLIALHCLLSLILKDFGYSIRLCRIQWNFSIFLLKQKQNLDGIIFEKESFDIRREDLYSIGYILSTSTGNYSTFLHKKLWKTDSIQRNITLQKREKVMDIKEIVDHVLRLGMPI